MITTLTSATNAIARALYHACAIPKGDEVPGNLFLLADYLEANYLRACEEEGIAPHARWGRVSTTSGTVLTYTTASGRLKVRAADLFDDRSLTLSIHAGGQYANEEDGAGRTVLRVRWGADEEGILNYYADPAVAISPRLIAEKPERLALLFEVAQRVGLHFCGNLSWLEQQLERVAVLRGIADDLINQAIDQLEQDQPSLPAMIFEPEDFAP